MRRLRDGVLRRDVDGGGGRRDGEVILRHIFAKTGLQPIKREFRAVICRRGRGQLNEELLAQPHKQIGV